MMGWKSRKKKHQSRQHVLDGYRQRHAAIFMPGWDEEAKQAGQDVRLALEMGCLNLDLPLIVVERNPDWAKLIKADLEKLGFTQLIVHAGELSDLKLTHKVDFAFIDLLGTLDYDICVWMRDVLAPRLVPNSTVALTLAYCKRNNQFMAMAERAFNDAFPDYVGALREAYGVVGRHYLIPILVFRSALQQHLFAYRKMFPYRDSNYRMITYRFDSSTRLDAGNGSPTLDDLVSHFTRKDVKAMTTKNSNAALKAWDTRRAKQAADRAAEKRSNAAHKAWATRRENAVVDARSAAALKAWETRRANGWVHPAHR